MNAEKAIFIKLRGNVTLTAFYFYQALYVLFSLANHFSNCQRENKNIWRREKKEHNQIRLAVTPRGYTHLRPLIGAAVAR